MDESLGKYQILIELILQKILINPLFYGHDGSFDTFTVTASDKLRDPDSPNEIVVDYSHMLSITSCSNEPQASSEYFKIFKQLFFRNFHEQN